MATRVIYDGSAFDTHVEPGVHKIGEDGKPIKRKYLKPPVLSRKPLDVKELWGLEFPKGEEVEVPPELVARGFLRKVKAMKCFKILPDQPEQLVAPAPAEPDSEDASTRRRGRPRRTDAE
jgi:hypothetical protein